jgi:ligand-binding SRPBCC domain-containing protein
MPIIELSTLIGAPPERVFDLTRSIDAHQRTTGGTEERAVAGVTSGLIGMNDEVTWEGRHFGIRQRLAVRVSAFDRPRHFQDVMISGAFKRMIHDHKFAEHPSGTQMCDRFEFTSPLGLLGRMADRLFLEGYMRRFLIGRNERLKRLAESSEGDNYLGQSRPNTERRLAPCMGGHEGSFNTSSCFSGPNEQTITTGNNTLDSETFSAPRRGFKL